MYILLNIKKRIKITKKNKLNNHHINLFYQNLHYFNEKKIDLNNLKNQYIYMYVSVHFLFMKK
jgi:hypothetical protein